MDPLSVVRDFTIRDSLSEIVRVNNNYRFSNSFTFPCTIPTGYQSKDGDFYTLETLIFFITNIRLKHHDYIRYAAAHKIPAVTYLDRKNLIDYLHGKIDSTDAIKFTAPSEYRPVAVIDSKNEFNLKDSIFSVDRPLRDKEMLLQCRNTDFYSSLVEANNRNESKKRKAGVVDDRFKKKVELEGSEIGEGVPIILVPRASQVLINIYNVKEFLEDGVFVPNAVKLKEMKGVKPDCVMVQNKFGRDRVGRVYEVRDKVKAEDWDRVVAAFVLGKEWQFRDWPFKDCVEIFDKILGFYMRFDDDSVESAKTAKQWNVKIISIGRNKRHQDRAAALDVWERLEEFMRSRSISLG